MSSSLFFLRACSPPSRASILLACEPRAYHIDHAHVRGEFVEIGESRLYYYAAGTRGAGEPVVFLHGFPTSGHLWGEVVEQMPAGHRIVVVDLLGYGRSDLPGAASLTLEAHAERVIALMDALGIAAGCIVGHDLGGGVAQVLAVRWPERVTRLALVDSIAFDAWPTRDVRIARRLLPLVRRMPATWLLPIVRAALERGYRDPARAVHSIDKYQRPFATDEGRRALFMHLAALDSRQTQQLSPKLARLAIPTTVIWGAHDPFLPLAVGKRLAAAIPGATFTVVPDGRHFTPEDAPRDVACAIDLLLRR